MYIATRHNKIIHYCESGYIAVGPTLICEAEKLALDSAICVEVDAVPTDIDKYDYFYVEGIFVKEEKKLIRQETIISEYTQYAEVGKWSDGNPENESRIGYFVSLDLENSDASTIKKAFGSSDIRGVTVSIPGFAINASSEKYATSGKLLKAYSYIATSGMVAVTDDGTCEVGGRCMPTDGGIATKVNSAHGYPVLKRIDANHINILVEPGIDCLYNLEMTKASCTVPITLSIDENGILEIWYDDGSEE